jgi:predicted DCC family thiol-disulfide oxidoreductase YuxK
MKVSNMAGLIYFDGQCQFCVALRERWGVIFERRGFVWTPLQTPGTSDRLGITEAQLQAEMWLQLADGRKLGGIDTWSALMRRVWWLWPVGAVLALPGFNAIGRALYRWIAKHRHCIRGRCGIPMKSEVKLQQKAKGNPKRIPTRKTHGRHTAFFELP